MNTFYEDSIPNNYLDDKYKKIMAFNIYYTNTNLNEG